MLRIFKKSEHSFSFLNATQFLGALNDNLFKFFLVFFLINVEGGKEASTILAIAGAVFVIPFLLFSSAAGVMADKISKTSIIISMKIAEVLIMSFGILAIFLKSTHALWGLLFLMAAQSAIFGPSKYGIIPEVVEPKKVSKANGVLNSFTFLAVIIGTFLASFITDITNKNFVLASLLCLVVAIVGLFTSIKITKTAARSSKKKINPLFIYEIYKTLKATKKRPYLLITVIGSAYFLFIGGFAQLNIIPFAMQSLNMTDVGGGYLFLVTAIGIAVGSYIAGKLSKEEVELAISCVAGFILSILLLSLSLFSFSFPIVVICLLLLGIFGGIFLIPFDAYIQLKSPDRRRGQIIAAANFLSFCGVLLASFFLYFISSLLKLSPAFGFFLMGIITFVFNLIITGKLADYFIPFIGKKFLFLIYKIDYDKIPQNSILILQKKKWIEALLLFTFIPNLKILTSSYKHTLFKKLFSNIYVIKQKYLKSYFEKAIKISKINLTTCIYSDAKFKLNQVKNNIPSNINDHYQNIYIVDVKYILVQKKLLLMNFHKKMLSYSFYPVTID